MISIIQKVYLAAYLVSKKSKITSKDVMIPLVTIQH